MPYCPKCGYEYEPETQTCADCGEALLAEPPTSAGRVVSAERSGPLVKVAEVANEALTAMWVELLANNGISALAKAKGVGYAYGYGSAATAPHAIFVAAADARRARDLLRSYVDNDPSITIAALRQKHLRQPEP